MDYFSVDIETSGPAPGFHSLLSLGVVHVRRREGRYRLGDELYVEVAPAFPRAEPKAMEINRLDLERLKTEGLPPRAAMERLSAFVLPRVKNKTDKPVFVAQNAPFDWMFVAYYYVFADLPNPFGFSALDLKAFAMGKLGLPWNETSLKQVVAKLPSMPARDERDLHHALADARYQALVFATLMNGG